MYCYEKGVTKVLPGVGAEAVTAPDWEEFVDADGKVESTSSETGIAERIKQYFSAWKRSERSPDHRAVDTKTLPESNFQWLPSEFMVPTEASTGKAKCQINSYINSLHPIKYKQLYDNMFELFLQALPLLEEVLAETSEHGKVRRKRHFQAEMISHSSILRLSV